jgi:hypothetical protein
MGCTYAANDILKDGLWFTDDGPVLGWNHPIVVLAARWVGSGSAGQSAPPASKSALDVLKERFARGQIDQAEFEQRKKLLSD